MRIQWFGSGTDIDTIPGFLTGIYCEELRLLGHDVEANKREHAVGRLNIDAEYIVVQDVDPRLPAFGDWLVGERARNPGSRCVLLTQSDWWTAEGIDYAAYVEGLYRRGAFDVILAYSRDGADEYKRRDMNAEFMCAVGAPSWWEPVPIEEAEVDVVFVGSLYNGRDAVQAAYVDAMRAAGLTVECYGERQPGGFVPFSRMRETLGRGRVVLALTTPLTQKYYGACTGRVFTGPWAGRVTISNWWNGISDFFDNAMLAVDDIQAVRNAKAYIANVGMDIYDLALAYQRKVVEASHLYRHRVETVLAHLKGDK